MRRSLLLCLATLLTLGLGACERDPLRASSGAFVGRWDGARWEGGGHALLVGDTLRIVGHRPDRRSHYDEYVWVHVPFAGTGTYALDTTHAQLQKVVGGDAGWFPRARGTLVVTHFSREERRVRGEIELTADGPDGKTWRFEEGRFDLALYFDYRDVPWHRR